MIIIAIVAIVVAIILIKWIVLTFQIIWGLISIAFRLLRMTVRGVVFLTMVISSAIPRKQI